MSFRNQASLANPCKIGFSKKGNWMALKGFLLKYHKIHQ